MEHGSNFSQNIGSIESEEMILRVSDGFQGLVSLISTKIFTIFLSQEVRKKSGEDSSAGFMHSIHARVASESSVSFFSQLLQSINFPGSKPGGKWRPVFYYSHLCCSLWCSLWSSSHLSVLVILTLIDLLDADFQKHLRFTWWNQVFQISRQALCALGCTQPCFSASLGICVAAFILYLWMNLDGYLDDWLFIRSSCKIVGQLLGLSSISAIHEVM